MPKFVDCEKREWELRLTLGLLPKLRDAGFDIKSKPAEPGGIGSLADDPERFGRVLFTLCEAQAKEKGISPEQFADGFDGEAIYAATVALWDAIVRFTQPPSIAAEVHRAMPGALAREEAKVVARLQTAMSAGLNDTAGSSPESPG